MPSKYSLLNDRDWLYQRYVVEGLSTRDLAALSGAKTPNSARQALIRSGIQVRTIGNGLRAKRLPENFCMNIDVFTGCMLGDATMRCWNRNSMESYPSFVKHNKGIDHVEFVARYFYPETWKNHIIHNTGTFNGVVYQRPTFSTGGRIELMDLYHAWYPEDVKVVPYDIRITPTTLLHWFMDDGCSWVRNRGYREIVIELATQSFSGPDVQRLIDALNTEFGFKAWKRPYRKNGQWRIQFPQSQASLFFEVIGPCPVLSMQYKWK